MAHEVVGCCLTLNEVLVLVGCNNCANNALLFMFNAGSLEVACRLGPGTMFVPLVDGTGLPLPPGCFMTIELLRILSLGLGLA